MILGKYWSTLPKFRWGPAFINELEVGFPLQAVKAYSTPAPNSIVQQHRDGQQSNWSFGHDQLLEAKVVAIPSVDGPSEFDPAVTRTGWVGDTGWEAFLEWCYQRRTVAFFPNHQPNFLDIWNQGHYDDIWEVWVTTPWRNPPTTGWNLQRDLQLTLRAAFHRFDFEFVGTDGGAGPDRPPGVHVAGPLTMALPFTGY